MSVYVSACVFVADGWGNVCGNRLANKPSMAVLSCHVLLPPADESSVQSLWEALCCNDAAFISVRNRRYGCRSVFLHIAQ